MRKTLSILLLGGLAISLLLRPILAQLSEELGISAKLPSGVKAVRDISYTSNGNDHQKLDLYLPEKPGGPPRPVIVRIHGGAWRHGDKAAQQSIANYVEKGFVGVAINYRFSQDAVFPAQLEDCKAAIRWLRAHAVEYNIDPNRIGVWGTSAGGHLAALLGTTGAVKQFDVGENLQFSSNVQAVIDCYGPTDFIALAKMPEAQAMPSRLSSIKQLLGGPVLENVERATAANPMTYISKNAPPFIILHGSEDPLVPLSQSEVLNMALKKAGVISSFYVVKNGRHGGNAFKALEYRQAIEDFLRKYLDPQVLMPNL